MKKKPTRHKLTNKRLTKQREKQPETVSGIVKYQRHYLVRHVVHIEALVKDLHVKTSLLSDSRAKKDQVLKQLGTLKDFLYTELYNGEISDRLVDRSRAKVEQMDTLKFILNKIMKEEK